MTAQEAANKAYTGQINAPFSIHFLDRWKSAHDSAKKAAINIGGATEEEAEQAAQNAAQQHRPRPNIF